LRRRPGHAPNALLPRTNVILRNASRRDDSLNLHLCEPVFAEDDDEAVTINRHTDPLRGDINGQP